MEINRNIVIPTTTYSDKLVVSLGGAEVHLIHAGSNHSDDGTILYFPNERAAHAVDFLNVKQIPYGFNGKEISPWLDSIDRVAELDIDTLMPGHGDVGSMEDLVAYRRYFTDLRRFVSASAQKGMSLEEIQQTIDLSAYSDWAVMETHSLSNIAEVYQRITED